MNQVKQKYIAYLDTARGAKKYNDFKKILYGRPDSLVVELFRRIYPEFKNWKNIRILDVGGGDGKRLKMIIDFFRKKRIGVSATLVEPSRAFTGNLKKSLRGQKKYDIGVIRSKFEDYSGKGKYNLILFIHSIFTFRNPGYLRKAKKMLAEDGLLIIMSNDPKSFIAGIKKITDIRYQSKRKEVESVFGDLMNCGFKYKIQKFDTAFRGITRNGKITGEGKRVLELISLSDYNNIDNNIKNKAITYFNMKGKRGLFKEREVLTMSKVK